MDYQETDGLKLDQSYCRHGVARRAVRDEMEPDFIRGGASLLGCYQQPREQKSDMRYNDPLFTQRSQRQKAGEGNAQSLAEHVPVTKQ